MELFQRFLFLRFQRFHRFGACREMQRRLFKLATFCRQQPGKLQQQLRIDPEKRSQALNGLRALNFAFRFNR